MLTSITVGNFKAFGPPQTLTLKPLTLLFGPNSAGKSSFMQAVLLMQHIFNTGDFDPHKIPGGQVDLGGFRNYVHLKDQTGVVTLGFSFNTLPTLEQTIECNIGMEARQNRPGIRGVTYHLDQQYGLEFEKNESNSKSIRPLILKRIQHLGFNNHPDGELSKPLDALYHMVQDYFPRSNEKSTTFDKIVYMLLQQHMSFSEIEWLEGRAPQIPPVLAQNELNLLVDQLNKLNKKKENIVLVEQELFKALPAMLQRNNIQIRALLRFFDPDKSKKMQFALVHLFNISSLTELHRSVSWEAHTLFKLLFLLQVAYETSGRLLSNIFELNRILKVELQSVTHLGPLREYPERNHVVANTGSGEDQFAQKLYRDPRALDAINSWLGENGNSSSLKGYRLKITGLYELADEEARSPKRQPSFFRVSLHDEQNHQEVSFRDVGVGISQIVPVLVQAYTSTEGVHFIEQPELHLHPKLQTRLGDAFIENLHGQVFVLETHSEHLILRLLRRVREKDTLRPDQLSVAYVMPTEQGSQVVPLRVSELGDFLDPWPEGFFDERMGELF